ncbi:MAG: hypothetical protein JWN32_3300 [Solirubrobacterales bacterium]|nr:hypothetical protein [Solirubrobacterales bacterium]
MKRLLLAAILAAVLVVPSFADGAGSRPVRVTDSFAPTATGTVVTSGATSRLLLDVKNALAGAGSASLALTPTTGGTVAKGWLYDGQGALRLRFVFTLAAPAADGSRAITATGKVLTGTGVYGHARGSFKVSGSRSATGVDTLKLKGRVTHDFVPPPVGSGRGQ